MKLSLILVLILVLFMSSIPGSSSCLSWVRNWDRKLLLPKEQHPLETKSQTSGWLCWFGVTTCPVKIEDGKKTQVLPEEQRPVDTKSQPSIWLCRFGVTTCSTKMEDGNKNQVLPEEQSPVETNRQPFIWLCWSGLNTCPWNGDKKLVQPEERLSINAERHASTWPFWLGFSALPKWVPYRVNKSVVPEGPNQQCPCTEEKTFSLRDILRHLWDFLKQITCFLKDHIIDYRVFRLLWVIIRLWKILRQRQR